MELDCDAFWWRSFWVPLTVVMSLVGLACLTVAPLVSHTPPPTHTYHPRGGQFFGDVDLMSAPMIAEFLERKLGRTSLGAPFLAAMQNLAQLPSQATPDNVRLWTEAAERILAPAPTVAPSLEASATGSEPGEALAATKRILELEAQVAALQEEIVGAKAEADDLRKEKVRLDCLNFVLFSHHCYAIADQKNFSTSYFCVLTSPASRSSDPFLFFV